MQIAYKNDISQLSRLLLLLYCGHPIHWRTSSDFSNRKKTRFTSVHVLRGCARETYVVHFNAYFSCSSSSSSGVESNFRPEPQTFESTDSLNLKPGAARGGGEGDLPGIRRRRRLTNKKKSGDIFLPRDDENGHTEDFFLGGFQGHVILLK